MKTTVTILWFVSALFVVEAASQTAKPPDPEMRLSQSKQAPKLQLILTCPEGWSFEWTPKARHVLCRIVRDGTEKRETIIVAATPLEPGEVGKSSDEVFNQGFVRDFGLACQAKLCRRVHDDSWNGVFTIYALPEEITKGKRLVDVESWMMISDGYRVEFLCYFEKDPSLPEGQARTDAEALRARYLAVLKTVRTAPIRPSAVTGEHR